MMTFWWIVFIKKLVTLLTYLGLEKNGIRLNPYLVGGWFPNPFEKYANRRQIGSWNPKGRV